MRYTLNRKKVINTNSNITLIHFELINYLFLKGDVAVAIDKSHDIWKELWEDNVHNTEGVLTRHLDSVYEFLGIAIKSSSWAMKAQVH